ncbi:MAG: signal peptidase II [Ignavibacteriaceae bacterium]
MRILVVSFIIVIVDQLTKVLVKGFSIPFLHIYYQGMYDGQKIPVIGNFFRITFIENPGMAFGFDPGVNYKLWISIFSLAASIGLVIYLYIIRNQKFSLRLAIAFILGGAVGNLIDRMFYGIFYGYAPLFYGRVVDFLDFDFFNINIFGRHFERWPIFNIADSAVTIGVIILLFFYKKPKSQNFIVKEVDNKIEISEEDNNTTDSDYSINKENYKNDQPGKGKDLPD